MLPKIHVFFKISLNIYEIHLYIFGHKILSIFRVMGHQTLIFHLYVLSKLFHRAAGTGGARGATGPPKVSRNQYKSRN